MLILSLTVIFSLGCLFGRLSTRKKNLLLDGGFGNDGVEWSDELCGRAQHNMKLRLGTKFEGEDSESGFVKDVVFYMARNSTKVHLTAQCQGLNPANHNYLIMRTLCKHCEKKKRLGLLYTR